MADAATAIFAILGLRAAHTTMGTRSKHETHCSNVEPTIRDIKYTNSSRLLHMRKSQIESIEEVTNNSHLGTPRYHVHLIDGTTTEVYGPVIADYVEPV